MGDHFIFAPPHPYIEAEARGSSVLQPPESVASSEGNQRYRDNVAFETPSQAVSRTQSISSRQNHSAPIGESSTRASYRDCNYDHCTFIMAPQIANGSSGPPIRGHAPTRVQTRLQPNLSDPIFESNNQNSLINQNEALRLFERQLEEERQKTATLEAQNCKLRAELNVTGQRLQTCQNAIEEMEEKVNNNENNKIRDLQKKIEIMEDLFEKQEQEIEEVKQQNRIKDDLIQKIESQLKRNSTINSATNYPRYSAREETLMQQLHENAQIIRELEARDCSSSAELTSLQAELNVLRRGRSVQWSTDTLNTEAEGNRYETVGYGGTEHCNDNNYGERQQKNRKSGIFSCFSGNKKKATTEYLSPSNRQINTLSRAPQSSQHSVQAGILRENATISRDSNQ